MAVILMMLSVLVWSVYPVIAAWGLEEISVPDFLFWSLTSSIVAAWIFLKISPSARRVKYKTFFQHDRKVQGMLLLYVVAFLGSQICLLGSFAFITEAGATIAYETWPIFAMYVTPLLMKKSWEVIPRRDYIFAVIALIGVCFILYPELQSDFLLREDVKFWHYGAILLPLLGGLCMAFATAFMGSAAHMAEVKGHPIVSLLSLRVALGWLFIPVTGIVALVWPSAPSTYTPENVLAMIFVGMFILTLGGMFYYWALLKATRTNINVLWYFVPLFSAVWFWWTGISEVTDYIIIGAILIISSNLLITTRADKKMAYMATLISLLVVGIYCYFTEGTRMEEDYYEAIGVPVVFFVILAAFTMDRLIRRDQKEESLGVRVMHNVIRNKKIPSKYKKLLIDAVINILRTKDTDVINAHYKKIMTVKYDYYEKIASDLDQLVLSKIHNTNFGDLFVTALVGIVTVGVTIAFREPEFVADAFSIGMTGAAVFLFFSIVDLSNMRRTFHLDFNEKGIRELSKDVRRSHDSDIILSSILIFLLLTAFTGLLWYKHF
ncbi:MAG: DMT family transporter [Micavibrio sp.]|nr:MAG: DMT family transporter [Micavibrio sp.]